MRTTLVSYNQVKNQNRILQILIVLFSLLSMITVGMALFEGRHMLWFNLPLTMILPFILYKHQKRIKSISYDDEAVYVSNGFNDPVQKKSLENIRSITIGRFDFSARLNLITAVEAENQIYFKYQALWKPFAARFQLDKIYKLRDKIDVFKLRIDEDYSGETQVIKMVELG